MFAPFLETRRQRRDSISLYQRTLANRNRPIRIPLPRMGVNSVTIQRAPQVEGLAERADLGRAGPVLQVNGPGAIVEVYGLEFNAGDGPPNSPEFPDFNEMWRQIFRQTDSESDSDNEGLPLEQIQNMYRCFSNPSRMTWNLVSSNAVHGDMLQMRGHLLALPGYEDRMKQRISYRLIASERSVNIHSFWQQEVKPWAHTVFRFVPLNKKYADLARILYKHYVDNAKVGEIQDQFNRMCVVPMRPGCWYSHTRLCSHGPSHRTFRVPKKCLMLVLFTKQ